MVFSNFVQWFVRFVHEGRARHAVTEAPLILTEAETSDLVEDVAAALSRLAKTPVVRVGAVDMGPYAQALRKAEPRVEIRRDLTSGAATPVRQFLYTIFEQPGRGKDAPGATGWPRGAGRVLPAWQAIYEVFASAEDKEDRKLAAATVLLQNVCLINGVPSPYEVPSYSILWDWYCSYAQPTTNKSLHATFQGFVRLLKRSREELIDPSIPNIRRPADGLGRGLQSLPELPELLSAAGCTEPWQELPTIDRLFYVAPGFATDYRRWAEAERQDAILGSTKTKYLGAADRFAAGLVRIAREGSTAGIPVLSEIALIDLFELTVTQPPPAPDAYLEGEIGPAYLEPVEVPLICVLLDDVAAASAEISPRKALTTVESGSVPFYTQGVREDLKRLYRMVCLEFADEMSVSDPNRWKSIEARFEAVKDEMKERNRLARLAGGEKDKRLIYFTLPQLVLRGLPALLRRAKRWEVQMDEYKRKHGTLEDYDGKKIARKFDRAARRYLLVAIIADDGLRIKNYCGALANVHFLPIVVRDDEGRPDRFVAMSTHFRGDDDPSVSFKKVGGGELESRSRRRTLTSALVDLGIFFRFWTESRPRALVARGLLGSIDEYDFDQDHFAVFVGSTRGRHKRDGTRDAGAAATGALTRGTLGNEVGRALYWVAREVFNLDLPDWQDPALRQGWYGLFGPHVIRDIIATYWGGLRGDWEYAAFLTWSTEKTLKKVYTNIHNEALAREYQVGPRYARRFDRVMDRLREARSGDDWSKVWPTFDHEDPDASLGRLAS